MPAASKLKRLGGIAHWLPGYLADFSGRAKRRRQLEYIVLCFVDHFEPSWGDADKATAATRMETWQYEYPRLAATIYDSTGRTLPHSWFYPFDEARPSELSTLSKLVFDGWGEIDLHLHHFHDTSDGLKQKLRDALELFGRYGALHDKEGRPSFGFIHGNWALGNSIPEACGVDDELPILREFGCYGDFTFPAPNRCQPKTTNRIYAASEKPPRPSEYGHDLGTFPASTLPIVQGPILAGKIGGRWRIDDGEIDAHNPFTPKRLRVWTDAGIIVRPQDRWGFVKIFTHGAPEQSAAEVLFHFLPALSEAMAKLDIPVVFATAREFLNIAYAAAAGKTGNPADYRDAYISPPLGRLAWADRGATIAAIEDGAIELTDIRGDSVHLTTASGSSFILRGKIKSLRWDYSILQMNCRGKVRVEGPVSRPEMARGFSGDGEYQPDDSGELRLRW